MSQISKVSKNNTTVTNVNGTKVCTLYSTPVVTFRESGRVVTLNTGGFYTATTRTRMTQCFREWGIPLSVGFSKKEGNRVRNTETGEEYEFGTDNRLTLTY